MSDNGEKKLPKLYVLSLTKKELSVIAVGQNIVSTIAGGDLVDQLTKVPYMFSYLKANRAAWTVAADKMNLLVAAAAADLGYPLCAACGAYHPAGGAHSVTQ